MNETNRKRDSKYANLLNAVTSLLVELQVLKKYFIVFSNITNTYSKKFLINNPCN